MVYVEDLGTVLNAPIDVVWRYLSSESHGAAHRAGLRNFRPKELTPSCFEVEAERTRHGQWERFHARSTDLAPVGIFNEELDSSMTGTKMIFLYSPRGVKTQVDVFGDLASTTLPADRLEPEALGLVEGAYLEDLPGLATFAREHASERIPAVRIDDVGSRFDAPVDAVWEYMLGGETHDAVHASTRNGRYEALAGTSFLFSSERRVEDAWAREVMRITTLQPIGIASEWLEGPFAGSKMAYIYRPHGDRTQIDAHGDFVSPTIPLIRLERSVRSMMETEYGEDVKAIRAFAAAKRAH